MGKKFPMGVPAESLLTLTISDAQHRTIYEAPKGAQIRLLRSIATGVHRRHSLLGRPPPGTWRDFSSPAEFRSRTFPPRWCFSREASSSQSPASPPSAARFAS